MVTVVIADSFCNNAKGLDRRSRDGSPNPFAEPRDLATRGEAGATVIGCEGLEFEEAGFIFWWFHLLLDCESVSEIKEVYHTQ